MKLNKLFSTLILVSFINMSILPAFAIQDTKAQQDTKALKKQEKMLKHRVKRNKKYNDDYKYGYVNMDFWKSFNDKNLDNYINLAIKLSAQNSSFVTSTFLISKKFCANFSV